MVQFGSIGDVMAPPVPGQSCSHLWEKSLRIPQRPGTMFLVLPLGSFRGTTGKLVAKEARYILLEQVHAVEAVGKAFLKGIAPRSQPMEGLRLRKRR